MRKCWYDINQCFVSSMCITSVTAADNWKLRINTSIFIDVYCSEIVSGKTATGNMKNCIIKNKVATGVYVRSDVKLVKLDFFKISNIKRENWVVITVPREQTLSIVFLWKTILKKNFKWRWYKTEKLKSRNWRYRC